MVDDDRPVRGNDPDLALDLGETVSSAVSDFGSGSC